MPVDSVVNLVALIRQHRLLEPAQLEEMTRSLAPNHTDPRGLAKELIQRNWLTPYQINQLFKGNAADLAFDNFVLLERIGEGGMGQVFKARHRRLGQIVALKIIRKDRNAGPDTIRRFEREIQAASKLIHPNIVRAIDANSIEGTHFFVMEYVEGTDLARLVKQQGPLPPAQAADYIRQAALGLQHAHEKGLVHRDIKPANLLLTKQGVVKLVDMGLARRESLEEAALSTAPDARRLRSRHARLHCPGAGAELQYGRYSQRSLQSRLHLIFLADGPTTVSGWNADGKVAQAPTRSTRAGNVFPCRCAAGSGGGDRPPDGQTGRGPLSDTGRIGRGFGQRRGHGCRSLFRTTFRQKPGASLCGHWTTASPARLSDRDPRTRWSPFGNPAAGGSGRRGPLC